MLRVFIFLSLMLYVPQVLCSEELHFEGTASSESIGNEIPLADLMLVLEDLEQDEKRKKDEQIVISPWYNFINADRMWKVGLTLADIANKYCKSKGGEPGTRFYLSTTGWVLDIKCKINARQYRQAMLLANVKAEVVLFMIMGKDGLLSKDEWKIFEAMVDMGL